MKSKIKLTAIFVLIGLMVLAGIVYLFKDNSSTEKTVKVVDYGLSVCTQDIPTSECGSYNVTVQATDVERTTYRVAGFSNQDCKLYYEVTPKISMAKEQNTQVILKVNNKGEIISVR